MSSTANNSLTHEEKLIARKLFQLEAYKRDGQSFENFFIRIMQFHNSEFAAVKPQGRIGDKKNDGFIKSKGEYYQVYAPEDATKREDKTNNKMFGDFEGLYKHWNDIAPIKHFYFVLNDKYYGAFPSIYDQISLLEKEYTSVKFNPFFINNLEDIFISLPKDQICDIIGQIVRPEDIQMFDIGHMDEVIKYLLLSENPYKSSTFPQNPDFDQKITFNGLSKYVVSFLQFGSYQQGDLEKYFKINSSFAKESLRQSFNDFYKEATIVIQETTGKSDLIFFYIWDKVFPSQTIATRNAVLVLMSYFFSYCDIFEEPIINNSLF